MEIVEQGRLLTVGVIGVGHRGIGQLQTVCNMTDVRVAAVCELYEDRLQDGLKIAKGAIGMRDYHEMLKMPEIEAVFIFTDWLSHIPIAIEAMKAGKEVAMEAGNACCWKTAATARRK